MDKLRERGEILPFPNHYIEQLLIKQSTHLPHFHNSSH